MIDQENSMIIDGLKCTIEDLKDQNDDLKKQIALLCEENERFREIMKTELEPRIRLERQQHNAIMSSGTIDGFIECVDELIRIVEEYPDYYDWNNADGNVYEMILHIIKCYQDSCLERYCIIDKMGFDRYDI